MTLSRLGAGLLAVIAFVALFAPLLSPYDPKISTGRPFLAPTFEHVLGTNDIGQDILSELIWGTRVSLTVGLVAALVATTIGVSVGAASGFFGGLFDAIAMRIVDILLVIPFLPLTILLAAYLGPGLFSIIAVTGGLLWVGEARIIRSQALTLAQREWVTAARSLGASEGRVLFAHIIPALSPLALAGLVQSARTAILLEVSLSFLGLGDPVQKSWGSILFYAQARGAFLTGAWPWWVLPPGIIIALTVLSLALAGFSVERRGRA